MNYPKIKIYDLSTESKLYANVYNPWIFKLKDHFAENVRS